MFQKHTKTTVPARGNISLLFLAMEGMDDASVVALGKRIEWREPCRSIERWIDSRSKREAGCIDESWPVIELLRHGNRRLLNLLIAPGLIGPYLPIQGTRDNPHNGNGGWDSAFAEAFHLADFESAKNIAALMSDTELQRALDPDPSCVLESGVLHRRLCRSNAPQGDVEKTLDLAIALMVERLSMHEQFLPRSTPTHTAQGRGKAIEELTKATCSGLLPFAAEAENLQTCQTLISKGGLPGRAAIVNSTFRFNPEMFWTLLLLARKNPKEWANAAFLEEDGHPPANGHPLLIDSVFERMSRDLLSAVHENNPPSPAKHVAERRDEITKFLVDCLKDGLAWPGQKIHKGILATCVEVMARNAGFLGPQWHAAVKSEFPVPTPDEIVGLLHCSDPALLLPRLAKASGKWNNSQRSRFFETMKAEVISMFDDEGTKKAKRSGSAFNREAFSPDLATGIEILTDIHTRRLDVFPEGFGAETLFDETENPGAIAANPGCLSIFQEALLARSLSLPLKRERGGACAKNIKTP